MAIDQYSTFIEEAFLKPIRSVLIIDDDYPTFDEILEENWTDPHNTSGKSWRNAPAPIKEVISSFRTAERPLVVDVHDGRCVATGTEEQIAAHLHQSDLLVLDYELDKARPGDGARAIAIIHSLMSNDHFNLVAVHTKEDLDLVFRELLIGLLSPVDGLISEEDKEEAKKLIEEMEDNQEGFNSNLLDTVTITQYLHFRQRTSTYLRTMMQAQTPYSAFKGICENASWSPDQSKLVLRYALSIVERNIEIKMNKKLPGGTDWSGGKEKWIRTDSVFVSFSNKTEKMDILSEVHKALNNWKPHPSRLFLAKIKGDIDEYGIVAQNQALGNKYALAYWYHKLLTTTDPGARHWLLKESVSRHSNQLLNEILPDVEQFASRLVKSEVDSDSAEEICKRHFKVNFTRDNDKLIAKQEHNAFVCSMQPQGRHLLPGHVFLMDNDYWVCLSPACDMIPEQFSDSNKEDFKDWLPFIGVRLESINQNKIPNDVQRNRCVFLQIDNNVKSFRLSKNDDSLPHWRILYAGDLGVFTESFNLRVAHTKYGSKRLVSNIYNSKVVSQLRYEYALNLIQKLGISMTRIGLDFASG